VRYSIDTSAILHAWRRSYPPEVFPSLWKKFDELIERGDLLATEEVLRELEKKDDEVHEWVKRRQHMIVPIDVRIQEVVSTILASHKKLLDTRKNRSGADPFVIALAVIRDCTVVTNEAPTSSPSRPNIPDVCSALGVRSIDVLGLIREQRWVI